MSAGRSTVADGDGDRDGARVTEGGARGGGAAVGGAALGDGRVGDAAVGGAAVGGGRGGDAAVGGGRGRTVVQGGRPKAYRPLPAADREAAFRAGVAAYEAGEFFEAHELLEPAWMGSDDVAERDLHQGLIKLAAAYVHAVRGNPLGMAKNLRGSRARLAAALAGRVDPRGLDLPDLLRQVDARLARLESEPGRADVDPPPLRGRAT